MSDSWIMWNPASCTTTSYMPPGEWDPAWTHQDRYTATVLYGAALARGWSPARSGSLAAMAVIKRRAPHTTYGEAWERDIAALLTPPSLSWVQG